MSKWEYKVAELRERWIGGKQSGGQLEALLNEHGQQGWRAMAAVLAAGAAVLVLAACGGGQPSTSASIPVIMDKLDAHGCTVGPAMTGDRNAASCHLWAHGNDMNAWVFASQKRETAWLNAWDNNPPGVLVTGPKWVVEVSTEAQAQQVVAALGGTAH